MATNRQKLEQIARIYPKITRYGRLYAGKRPDSTRIIPRAEMHIFMKNSDGQYHIHSTVFQKKKKPMNEKMWADWFSKHLRKIFEDSVIPSMEIRTSMLWEIKKIIGWHPSYAVDKSVHSYARSQRHKTKRKGRANV